MRFPWVWTRREEIDRLCRLLDQAADVLNAERQRYDQLVDRMSQMQRAGFHPPVPPPAVPPPDAGLPVEVQVALEARVNPRSPVGRKMAGWAAIWLAEGRTPTWVADQILRGAE